MLKITKGNPTPEELAALLSVLVAVRGDHQRRAADATFTGWRSAPALDRCDGRWRTWSAGWSCWSSSGPGHAPARQRAPWAADRKIA
jgi:hypothetical protein